MEKSPEYELTDEQYSNFITRWTASSKEESEKLIDEMISMPSRKWLDLMNKAETNSITNAEVLLDNSSRIYESIAEATADEDGLVIPYKA